MTTSAATRLTRTFNVSCGVLNAGYFSTRMVSDVTVTRNLATATSFSTTSKVVWRRKFAGIWKFPCPPRTSA